MGNRKIIVRTSTGYSGMEGVYFYEITTPGVTQEDLDELAYTCAVENAASYGIYPYPEEDEDEEEFGDTYYSDSIEGSVHTYDPTKHDRLVPGNHPPEFREF